MGTGTCVSSPLLEGFQQEQDGLCPGVLGKEPGLRVRGLSLASLGLSSLNSQPRKAACLLSFGSSLCQLNPFGKLGKMNQDLRLREICVAVSNLIAVHSLLLGSAFRENPQRLFLALFPLSLLHQTSLPTSSPQFRPRILKHHATWFVKCNFTWSLDGTTRERRAAFAGVGWGPASLALPPYSLKQLPQPLRHQIPPHHRATRETQWVSTHFGVRRSCVFLLRDLGPWFSPLQRGGAHRHSHFGRVTERVKRGDGYKGSSPRRCFVHPCRYWPSLGFGGVPRHLSLDST